ncbi:hypothetical protein GW17_00060973, partial [Ensete ventricosum]
MAIAAAASAAVSSPNPYCRPNNPRLPHQQETAASATLIVKPKSSIFGRRALSSFLYYSQPNDGGRMGALRIRSEMTTASATTDDPGYADRGAGLHHIPRSSPFMAASPAVASSVAQPPRRYKKNVCLFYCEEMREIAERVALESDSIDLRSISWRHQLGVPHVKFLLCPFQISIAFPDDGAWKRFHKQLQHFPMVMCNDYHIALIICNKVREGDRRIVRLKEGDPRGRHVVIVDDLVQSGGTLIECQ